MSAGRWNINVCNQPIRQLSLLLSMGWKNEYQLLVWVVIDGTLDGECSAIAAILSWTCSWSWLALSKGQWLTSICATFIKLEKQTYPAHLRQGLVRLQCRFHLRVSNYSCIFHSDLVLRDLKKPWLDTLPLCQRFPYAPFNAMVTKISKWSRIQDSCRLTPKI